MSLQIGISVLQNETIKRIVEEVARKRFTGGEIAEIQIGRDTGFDGEEIIVVRVIVSRGIKKLDGQKAVGMIGHVRSKLSAQGEHAFPLLSFISQSEVGAVA